MFCHAEVSAGLRTPSTYQAQAMIELGVDDDGALPSDSERRFSEGMGCRERRCDVVIANLLSAVRCQTPASSKCLTSRPRHRRYVGEAPRSDSHCLSK